MSDDPARQIRKALLKIIDHYDDTIEPARRAPGSHVKTSKEAPLPISVDILDKRLQCRTRLAKWCWVTIRDRDLHTENLSVWDVPGMCDLLQRHADWLSETEDGPIVVWELEASARDLRDLAAPPRRDWMSLGICPLIIEAVVEVDGKDTLEPVGCTGTIRAYPEADPYCDSCGTVAVVSWWEKMQFPELDDLARLATSAQLVEFVHRQFGRRVVEVTIRQWVHKGIIQTVGKDDKGRTLYDKAAVAYALTRHAERVGA